ncbi:hypothetical protein [Paenibacillus montanisoli]|uniref:Uncharacterized protein n=1 Tax=Paenibacillus montanisoli TaxID=2081970 RepID=A0A328UAB5_9BACL|nr:hypothetical protein [Paenibacillus montanisoli]RAP76986.1 hypothetical protein DL346_00310 [Paenibacillus montanisoli]
MSPLIGAIMLYLVALMAFMFGTVVFIRYAVNRAIGQKHRLLEEIMETGKLPQVWLDGAMRPSETEKQVKSLATYVRKTRLVDSEETRTLLLTRLENARSLGKE